mgnify:CR=1 FL=1
MPDGIELAKAYVQIVPSAEGIQGKITEALGGEPAAAGDAAGQSLGAQLVGTLKKVIAAAGIGKIISESINLGGALQQSLGGVETLFGAGGRTIEEYAQSVGKSVEDVRDKYEILMLVIEGRLWLEGINGTSVNTCSDILLKHGCMQAMNLDGGSSAMMWFDI